MSEDGGAPRCRAQRRGHRRGISKLEHVLATGFAADILGEMSGLELPATLDAAEVSDWSDDADVVVIGFRIAGGCAAVSSGRRRRQVLVLERSAAAGGTTSLAGGHFISAGVPRCSGHRASRQRRADVRAYLVAMSREPEYDKIRAYCEGGVEHFNWLGDLGVHFERSYYPEKAVIQPGTEGLMYTGNEKVWPFKDLAVPAPRGHKVPVQGDTGGAAMVIDLLLRRAADLGVRIHYETGATNLVISDPGPPTRRWRACAGGVSARPARCGRRPSSSQRADS